MFGKILDCLIVGLAVWGFVSVAPYIFLLVMLSVGG